MREEERKMGDRERVGDAGGTRGGVVLRRRERSKEDGSRRGVWERARGLVL